MVWVPIDERSPPPYDRAVAVTADQEEGHHVCRPLSAPSRIRRRRRAGWNWGDWPGRRWPGRQRCRCAASPDRQASDYSGQEKPATHHGRVPDVLRYLLLSTGSVPEGL